MKKLINTALVAGIQILVVVLAALAFNLVQPAEAHAGKVWQPCPNDSDSVNCVWDARHMGNGTGHSYLATRKGRIVYISHRRAHHLLGL